MGTGLDFGAINAAALRSLESLVREWFPNGALQGREYCIGNVRGDMGDSLKVNLETGVWTDFAGSEGGGDPISLYAAKERVNQGQAAAALSRRLGIPLPPREGRGNARKPKPTTILPVPDYAGELPKVRGYKDRDAAGRKSKEDQSWRDFPIVAAWPYLDAQGRRLGYACRIGFPDGSKDVVPLTWCRGEDGKEKWTFQSFPQPRPLYGLDRLSARPGVQVIVVEGEKCADAAARLFPTAVAVTWPGGAKVPKYADWRALARRKVIVWPDADKPGYEAALRVAGAVKGIAAGVRVFCPEGKPEGWDCADAEKEGWTPDVAFNAIRAALLSPEEFGERKSIKDEPASRAPANPGEPAPGTVLQPTGPQVAGNPAEFAPFLCLGYDHGVYFYLSHGTKQVFTIPGGSHTKAACLTLAPLEYWERYFPGDRRGANWDMAINWMLRMCERGGVYDPNRIQGRGAWYDDGAVVLHLGNKLLVDGKAVPLQDHQSRYVYEAAATLRAPLMDNPLGNKEAHRFFELCQRLPWERDLSAYLLAGWCAIAPVCGAFPWRPHLWLTGATGTGKTWVFENIVGKITGDFGLKALSETTEAGLRQTLGTDARPIIFDEAEGEDVRSQQRIQNVMALMRAASAESGGSILKGSANGKSVTYRIRSMFAFASIGVNAKQHADRSRITILSMQKDIRWDKEERAAIFAETQKAAHALLTEEYIQRMIARTIGLIPVIRKNAEAFSIAGARVLGTRRLGDQLGALLAGAHSLHSEKELTPDEAEAWLKQKDWTEEVEQQDERDELSCLQRILETTVRVTTGTSTIDKSIGELVQMVHRGFDGTSNGATIPLDVAKDVIKRHGVKVDGQALIISNSHNAIARILKDSAWPHHWGRILKRNDGAEASKPQRFGPGPVQRAVAIPISAILETTT